MREQARKWPLIFCCLFTIELNACKLQKKPSFRFIVWKLNKSIVTEENCKMINSNSSFFAFAKVNGDVVSFLWFWFARSIRSHAIHTHFMSVDLKFKLFRFPATNSGGSDKWRWRTVFFNYATFVAAASVAIVAAIFGWSHCYRRTKNSLKLRSIAKRNR